MTNRALLALVLGVLAFLTGAWTAAPADPAREVVSARVRDAVRAQGAARVLVELRLPAGDQVPEGSLSPTGTAIQRQDIAAARSRVLSRLAAHPHRVLHRYASLPLVALDVGADALAELEAGSFWVKRVSLDTLKVPGLLQSVPLIGADQGWTSGFDGTGVAVAILDTGVQSSHPFLAGKVVEEACYSSSFGGSTTLCPNRADSQVGTGAGANCTIGSCWHGTHVAGIAAGNGAGAGVSYSGVARGADIIAVQVFSRFDDSADCGGSAPCIMAWTSDIIAGLERVYELRASRHIAAVNLSLGGGLFSGACDDEPEKAIIDNLRSAGIATVVAAGNDGSTSRLSSPACISSTVSVGATTKSNAIASFTNAAPMLSLFAPGASIKSSVAGGGFGIASGTSMAAPHVTGAWAVLRQAAPTASVGELLTALQSTGLPIKDTRSGGAVTRPRIHVADALTALTFDYRLNNSGNVSLVRGTGGATTITATFLSGDPQAVALVASGLPAGATAAFGPGSCTPGCDSTLTISTTSSTPTGTFPITVKGSPLGRTTTFTLVVTAPPPAPFAYSLSTSGSLSIVRGKSKSNTVTVTLDAGTAQRVTLAAAGLPALASAKFSSTSCTPTCKRTLTISTKRTTPVGTFVITVTGSPLGKTTSFDLVVTN